MTEGKVESLAVCRSFTNTSRGLSLEEQTKILSFIREVNYGD